MGPRVQPRFDGPRSPVRISPVGFQRRSDGLRRELSRGAARCGPATEGRHGGVGVTVTSPHSCSRAFCVTEQRLPPLHVSKGRIGHFTLKLSLLEFPSSDETERGLVFP